jgi:hypothetical protein
MEELPSVVPVKPILVFTRCSASTRRREGGSIFLVIPDIFNRASILVSFRMDTRYKLQV